MFEKNKASRRWLGPALGVAGCLVLTACGGSSDDSTSGSGSSGGDGKIVIGYAASQSGPQAQNGLVGVAAAKAWAESTNAAGGINGQQVEIKAVDTKGAVPSAVAGFKGLQQDEDVDAIVVTDLIAEAALAKDFASADLAVLSGGGAYPEVWNETPGLYQPVADTRPQASLMALAVQASGATKLGFAACSEVASCAENAKPTQAAAKALGISDAGTQTFTASATDYTAQCLGFDKSGADALAFNIGIDVGVRVMANCLQQGYKGVFVMPNSGFDQTKVAKVDNVKSVNISQGFPWWADTPEVKAYRDAMAKYSPDQPATGGQATSVWAMLELLKKSLTDAKPATIDRASVLTSLDSVKDETLNGLLSQPITFTKGEPSPDVKCSWVFKYDSGDADPTIVPPADGKSGNGLEGDLASSCVTLD